jgi:hypothetical protein
MMPKQPFWSFQSIKGIANHLLIDDPIDIPVGLGRSEGSSIPLAKVKCISAIEDWLNFSEDSREYSINEIQRIASEAQPFDFYVSERIFSTLFVDILKRLQIENFEAFPVVLEHPYTGRIWDDYFIVNVIGLTNKMPPQLKISINERGVELLFDDEVKKAVETLDLPRGQKIEFMQRFPRF